VSRLPVPGGDLKRESREVYGVVFQFAHAPDDAIELIVEKRQGSWVVAQFDWLAL
jgi:hypothetical protein